MQQLNSDMKFVPDPSILHTHEEDEEADEMHEEAKAVIEEVERNSRKPSDFFGGSASAFVDPMTDDHGLVPVAESPGQFAEVKAHEKHVHNDVASHSPLYIFMCIVLISAVGFFLFYSNAKERLQQMISAGS